jgi:hypothetical protein
MTIMAKLCYGPDGKRKRDEEGKGQWGKWRLWMERETGGGHHKSAGPLASSLALMPLFFTAMSNSSPSFSFRHSSNKRLNATVGRSRV